MENMAEELRNDADWIDANLPNYDNSDLCRRAADRVETLEGRLAEAYQMVGNVAYHLAETKEDQQNNLTALLDLLSKD